jgi:hypothetical protein
MLLLVLESRSLADVSLRDFIEVSTKLFILLLYIFRKLYPKHIDKDDLQGLINIREALLALSVRL